MSMTHTHRRCPCNCRADHWSHLGLEPQGGSGGRRGTRAGRLLFQLVLDEFEDESTSTPASGYMQLAVYDLIGEIFTPSDPKTVCELGSHRKPPPFEIEEKLFPRLRALAHAVDEPDKFLADTVRPSCRHQLSALAPPALAPMSRAPHSPSPLTPIHNTPECPHWRD